LILVTPDPATAMLIRRGKRVADYLHADCFAVAISQEIDLHDMPARDRELVEHHLNFARNLHIETRVLQGQDVAQTLVEFAHLNGVTHLFLARPQSSQWPALSRRSLVQQVVHLARDMQVTIAADRANRQQPQPV
jgi:two-component system sensor histidine kinase KdpD